MNLENLIIEIGDNLYMSSQKPLELGGLKIDYSLFMSGKQPKPDHFYVLGIVKRYTDPDGRKVKSCESVPVELRQRVAEEIHKYQSRELKNLPISFSDSPKSEHIILKDYPFI